LTNKWRRLLASGAILDFVTSLRANMRIPPHAKPLMGDAKEKHRIKALLRKQGLHTVCESARCPNIGECFSRKTATFMILGDTCTRSCAFCAVRRGAPSPLDPDESRRVAQAARALRLKHVVVTSVTRDDLPDGGAEHFARVIEEIRRAIDGAVIEALIPDFKGEESSLKVVIEARPDVLNHNMETVPRLYHDVRPLADYRRSIELIARAGAAGITTKSGLLLGIGEEFEEVLAVMKDLRAAGCKLLTLGQYLRPTRQNRPVTRYLEPREFDAYRAEGEKMGFSAVAAAPLVRSSYRANEILSLP